MEEQEEQLKEYIKNKMASNQLAIDGIYANNRQMQWFLAGANASLEDLAKFYGIDLTD